MGLLRRLVDIMVSERYRGLLLGDEEEMLVVKNFNSAQDGMDSFV